MGRFVLVPHEDFGGVADLGGWIAKIMSIHNTTKHTKLQLHDSREHLPFAYVAEHFKRVS